MSLDSKLFQEIKTGKVNFNTNDQIRRILNSNMIYNRADIEWYTKFNRFGCIDPYNALNNTKEYIFFTKPDLHICKYKGSKLNEQLEGNNFFEELYNRYPGVISHLQKSSRLEKNTNTLPFMNLLSNSVQNSLDLPEISAEMVEGNKTSFGTNISYRGDGYKADEGHDFTLEFEDTKYLELYHLFKAYEEYERLKRHGLVSPPGDGQYTYYHKNMIIHDQFAGFKFIVDDDMETIIYYAILQGVSFKSVPRDAFSDLSEGKLKYSIGSHAQFVFDMEPWILNLFNDITTNSLDDKNNTNYLNVYDPSRSSIEASWATTPIIVRVDKDSLSNANNWLAPNNMSYMYKLKWV